MKTYPTYLCSFIALVLLAFAGPARAQNMFLQGRFLETGVAPNGNINNAVPPPPGYQIGAGWAYGMVVDPDKDGWTVGTPVFMGDYIGYGYPYEAWRLDVDGVQLGYNSLVPGDTALKAGMTGNNVRSSVLGTKRIITWSGSWNDLALKQRYTIDVDHLYILIDVVLSNRGTATIPNIYYARECDPDVDGDNGFTGTVTFNRIVSQPSACSKQATIYAFGNSLRQYVLGYTTQDRRAKAYFIDSALTSIGVSLDSIYHGRGDGASYAYTVNDTSTQDRGMGVVFKLDSLLPGHSTSWSIAYVLDTAEVPLLFKTIPSWSLSSGGKYYERQDTIFACPSDSIEVLLQTGTGTWTWDPSPRLSVTSGAVNTISVSGTNTYRAVYSDSVCTDTLEFTVMAWPVIKPVLSRTGALLSCSGSYSSYQWYKNDTLLAGAIRKDYTMSGDGRYFVTVTDKNGCTANSDTITYRFTSIPETELVASVHVHPNPVRDLLFIEAAAPVSVELYDAFGRLLLSQKEGAVIDLAGCAPGLYLLRISDTSGGFICTRKLIRQ